MSLVTRLSRTSTYSLLLLSVSRTQLPTRRPFSISSFNMSSITPWDPSSTPYPSVRRSDTVEEFNSASKGTVKVQDPYDWLSQPDSKETKQFVKDQGEFTKRYLDQYKDKDKFSKELEKNWNYARCQSLSPQVPPPPLTDGNWAISLLPFVERRWLLLLYL